MKLIIAGCRDCYIPTILSKAVSGAFSDPDFGLISEITEIVTGGASGVDAMGKRWALGLEVPHTEFKADWTAYGNAAGPIRNRQMADYADALIAIWDGKSRGTKNMIEEATKRGLRVYVHRIDT